MTERLSYEEWCEEMETLAWEQAMAEERERRRAPRVPSPYPPFSDIELERAYDRALERDEDRDYEYERDHKWDR